METILVFLALVIASMTLYVQRVHNRKQVLPIVHLYESLNFEDGRHKSEIKLYNDGLGPAKFKSLTLTKGEVNYQVDNYDDLGRHLAAIFPCADTVNVSLPHCLKANSSVVLYTISVRQENLQEYNTIKMDVIVSFESLYDDLVTANLSEVKYSSNKHDHFFESQLEKLTSLFSRIK